ncbi:flagellar hook capping FlgD N-terminal domain-containing protein [Limnohabitans sp. Rim8]|jgi:flagellar basal-body rod modification protein FlgD|uniref:flagellar hook assembly protein FlgD n=1 Tax=Limnohabitans sp. Rim8 TaxID=1100718 RepID=UPI0025D35EEB|nr:flagellar hook capping FlgD N-terminal domain-containing protein [Limnohabitans sp. Rim8]
MATSNVTSSSLLQNVSRYEDVKEASKKTKEDMGKQEFLTLFTAQLQNQNPLEPVKNEAFVAQLAQFSQLEALTNMQGSLDKFVTSMSSERMLGSASLIGKKVAVTDTPTQLTSGGVIDGSIDLPMGASGIQVSVFDSQGRLVQELIAGPQLPGTTPISWNGKDAAENPVPSGLYRLSAKAVVNGQTTDVPVSTLSTVRAISSNPTDGSVSVEVDGGKTMLLTDVKRVGI